MIYDLDLIRDSLPLDLTFTFTKFATYLGGQFQSPRNTPSRTDRLIMRGSAIFWFRGDWKSPGFAWWNWRFQPFKQAVDGQTWPGLCVLCLAPGCRTWSIDAGWAEMLLVLSYSSILWNVYHSILILHHVCIIFAGFLSHCAPCAEVYRGLLNGAAAAVKAPHFGRDGLRNAGRVAAQREAVTDDVKIEEEVRLLKRRELKKMAWNPQVQLEVLGGL